VSVATYAVKWREPDGQIFVGRLALSLRALQLDGRGVSRELAYDGLRVGADRLDGRPALALERADGRYLVAGVGLSAPVVQELADRIAERCG
jgi:hypothetical protein